MLDIRECLNNSNSHFWQIAGTYDINLQQLAEDIFERFFSRDIEDIETDPYDLLYSCIEDALIYYNDQWTVLKSYCNPTEANWEEAIDQFTNDLINSLDVSTEEEEEEEEEE